MTRRPAPRVTLLLALLLSLSTMAANCQEQLAATFPEDDAGLVPSVDATAGDAGLVDVANVDSGQDDAELLDLVDAPDMGASDAGASDAAEPDTATGADAAVFADAAVGADSSVQADAGDGYHPPNWPQLDQHAFAAKEQREDCRGCHGDDLNGTAMAPSCDSCHTLVDPGWRTNCVFCHGGTDDQSGAPPDDLHEETDATLLTVGAHTEHAQGADHAGYSCDECHLTPTDVLSPGHMFDSSAGLAEVAFGAGISTSGAYATGICSAVYCHGDGVVAGASPSFDDVTDLDCAACHEGVGSATWSAMSGGHASHLGRGDACAECHAAVIDPGDVIVAAALHVNGAVEVEVPTGAFDALTDSCTTSCHSVAVARGWYDGGNHPEDWDLPVNHGPAALNASDDCTVCHGTDLNGGSSGISCDSCHVTVDPGWRTNCVFCHGGTDDQSGAPPIDLDGTTDVSALTVGAHTEHSAGADHAAVVCGECHLVPTDVLSAGHMFDGSAGVAEVDLSLAGISGGGYSGGACSAVYCHGDGQVPGAAPSHANGTDLGCTACHQGVGGSVWSSMSGRHATHLGRGDACAECHAAVIDPADQIVAAALHVNGGIEVEVPTGAYVGATGDCTTTCHSTGEPRNWVTGGNHPADWDLPANHGPAALRATQDCTVCHGADLLGGSSGIDCDSCHVIVDPGWRTNCVFCHGGGDNSGGAPPIDLDGASGSGLLTVGAHTEHVTETDHPAYDCSECHLKPVDVTSAGHMFDATPGVSEVVFDTVAGSLSDAASYASPGCSALYCHGYRQLDNGTAADFTGSISACDACHPFMNSGGDVWGSRMRGQHKKHLDADPDSGGRIQCWECHGAVLDASNQIQAAALHVNGQADIQLVTGTFSGGRCSITDCHGEGHSSESWGN